MPEAGERDASTDDRTVVLPDHIVFDDTEAGRAVRQALVDLAEQAQQGDRGPTPDQLATAARRLSSDDF
jgi:hypothetical protein